MSASVREQEQGEKDDALLKLIEALQHKSQEKSKECEWLCEEVQQGEEKVESALERCAQQALEAEQERGRVLKRAAQAEAAVQRLQKEMLDGTCKTMGLKQDLENAQAAYEQVKLHIYSYVCI